MSTKRKPAPSHRKILDAWFNLPEAEIMLGWECFDNIAECTHNHWNCWACGLPKNQKALEKCHIVPHSLEGDNEPLNYFLMCSECHRESPDTKHYKVFISWVSNKSSYTDDFINQIYNTLSQYDAEDREGDEVLKRVGEEMQEVGTHGGKLVRSTSLGILNMVCEEVYNG